MQFNRIRCYLRNSIVYSKLIFISPFILTPLAFAEISTDNSLGTPATSISGPDYAISDILGRLEGNNLFHSFSVFNINSGETANFSGPASVNNIFSRVTGGTASTINGQLGSDIVGANLYFINPNGIVFGDNASLNLTGSFYASTADYITLQDGARFAADQGSDVTLSSSPIAAFGFLDAPVAGIQLNQSNLQVAEGKTLGLIGGDITVQGNGVYDSGNYAILSNAELVAVNGRLDLVSLASSGEVDIQNNNVVLNNVTQRGNINFSNAAEITVRGNPGGRITIRAGRLTVEDTVIDAANNGDLNHQDTSVDIDVTGTFNMTYGALNDSSTIQASSYSTGNAGNLHISSNELNLFGSADSFSSIASRVFNAGNSGNINIETGDLNMASSAIVTQSFGTGDSGNINLVADTISQGGDNKISFISSSAFNQGNAGNINITADKYTVTGGEQGFVGIAAQVSSAASGTASAGNIVLNINEIELLNSAQISAGRFAGSGISSRIDITSNSILISGRSQAGFQSGIYADLNDPNFSGTSGAGGNININTSHLVIDDFGTIDSTANFPTTGDSGDINITADSIQLSNAGTISSSSFGSGRSGQIDIQTQTLDIKGSDQLNNFDRQSGIYAGAGAASSGSQNINVNADQGITVRVGGFIAADTFGNGNGGDINITAPVIDVTGKNISTDLSSTITSSVQVNAFSLPSDGHGGNISLNGDTILISDQAKIATQTSAAGDAGEISIQGVNVSILDDAVISATSSSTGDAGAILIAATDTLKVDSSSIETETIESDGGNISLMATKLMTLENSNITTSVQGGTGRGGNISIDPELLFINKSNIVANAFEGAGGNISLQADNMIISPDSNISASSLLGVDGQLIINTNNDDVGSQVEKISASTTDESVKFKQDCVASNGLYSSFVINKASATIFEQTGLIFNHFDSADTQKSIAGKNKNKSNLCS